MLQENETDMRNYIKNNGDEHLPDGHIWWPTMLNGFYYIQFKQLAKENKRLDSKIDELRAENKELLSKFNEILTAVTKKKTDSEEIAELQAHIQAIYNKRK
jgi:hypothetical protein